MFRDSLKEMEQLLSGKSVVGDAIQIGDATVIPLLSTGFGFGGAGGSGKAPGNEGEGTGGGTGAGGGVKPVAVIISDATGVRIERIAGPGALESIGTAVARAIESERAK